MEKFITENRALVLLPHRASQGAKQKRHRVHTASIWSTRDRDAGYSRRGATHGCLVYFTGTNRQSARGRTLRKVAAAHTATGGIRRERTVSDTNQPPCNHSKQRSEVVRGSERGFPHCPCSTVTVSNDHFCDYATGLILLAATSQK